MQFINPGFLWALSALAIPIIIHLFSFRKFKKVYFTNVRFLRELKRDTQSRTRLKHWLVLACRILAISFLVFAFARPILPGKMSPESGNSYPMSIFIDNSFSMDATGKSGNLLSEAVESARVLVASSAPARRIHILTADFETRHQRSYTREEALLLLDEIKIGPSSRSLREIISRQSENAMAEKHPLHTFIFSDFQKSHSNLQNLKKDSAVTGTLIHFGAQRPGNLSVDSCWFSTPVIQPGKPAELMVQISNHTGEKIDNTPVALLINGKQKGLAGYSGNPKETSLLKIPFTISSSGIQNGKITIEDYPITFDDHYFFNFEVLRQIPMLIIEPGKTEKYLQAVFASDSVFKVTTVQDGNIQFSTFPEYKFILLAGIQKLSSGLILELKKFLHSGGTVCLVPGEEPDLSSINAFASIAGDLSMAAMVEDSIRLGPIQKDISFFEDVFESPPAAMDMPMVKKRFPLKPGARIPFETLLSLENGAPFLGQIQVGNGTFFLFATSFSTSFTNFPRNALFVPVMYNIAFKSLKTQAKSFFLGGQDGYQTGIPFPGPEGSFLISDSARSFSMIPEIRNSNGKSVLFFHHGIKMAGNGLVESGGKPIEGIAFNYSRTESAPACFSAGEIENAAEKIGFSFLTSGGDGGLNKLSIHTGGTQLWRYCIALCLLFFILETIFIRFLK